MVELERTICGFAESLAFEDIPEDVRLMAKRCFADTVGVMIAGGNSPQQKAAAAILEHGGDKKRFVSGLGLTQLSLSDSIFVNALCAHAQEYNDLFYCRPGHPSTSLVPVAMGLGEDIGADGRRVLTAYTAGLEVMSRINKAMLPETHNRGFHTTSVAGVIGCAVCAGKLLGLSGKMLEDAINIACSFAAGLRESFGTMANSFHVGLAAVNGLRAAQLASKGADGASGILTGGFARCYSMDVDTLNAQCSSLGIEWAFRDPGIIIKRYPCCFSTYQAVEAALKIVAMQQFNEKDIESVEILTSENHFMSLPSMWPKSLYGQRFCVPYCVSAVLHFARMDVLCFGQGMEDDADLLSIGRKCSYGVDPQQRGKEGFGHSSVSVLLSGGTKLYSECFPNQDMLVQNWPERQLKERFALCSDRDHMKQNGESLYDEIIDWLDGKSSIQPKLSREKVRYDTD